MNKIVLIVIIFILALITCNISAAADTDHTYTLDEDFDKGNLTGLEHNNTHNQLQLSNNTNGSSGIIQPFIWVPNSNQGTVSKVDTLTGKELARYRTSPENVSQYANPSRTTVDLLGNCWVGNRQTGTAVKIGLYENNQYIDRNHNGIIETSQDLNNDGVISDGEILPWGQDECVFYEIILIPGKEGTYKPGDYKGTYTNDYYNPGPRGLAVDSKNNVWIGTFGSMKYYYVNGATGQILKCIDISSTGHTPYGAVIDQNGILWSSGNTGNNILRLDPSTNSFSQINLNHIAYGLALDNNNHLFVSGLNDYLTSRINVLTGEIEWTKTASYGQGIATTSDGDIWTANNILNTVSRFSNDGILNATILVGKTPTGVAVDREGKVWVVDVGDENIYRIDPATNTIDITKQLLGCTHYGYSDMTGLLSNTITTRKGIWTIIHDSELQNTPWGVISWNSFEPQGTSIKVRVRSSNNKQNWSDWEETINGSQLSLTPPGRYLQVETTLQIFSGNLTPILYDLNVRAPLVDIALTSSINNPTPHPGDIVQFTIDATNNGPTDANGVKVNYHLPSGFGFISSSFDYNPTTSIWNIGNLSKGASDRLIIQAQSKSTGQFISSAWASSYGYDINMTNNIAFFSISALALPSNHSNPPVNSNITPGIPTQINPENLNTVNAHQRTSKNQRIRSKSTLPMQETGIPLNLSGLAILLIMFGNIARRKRIINNKFFWILIALCFIFIACGTVSAADNTTICVSNSPNGTVSYGESSEASISADGNYITFNSNGDNLVSNDANGCSDIFVYDVNSGKTMRVSVSSNGSESDSNSYESSISADGRYITFASYASNLVEGDSGYHSDIFVHDRNSKTTTRISVSSTGEEADGDSFAPSISGDGHYVVFLSKAYNLVNTTLSSNYYGIHIFIHDMVSGTTENIPILNSSEFSYYGQVSISSNGRYIIYKSGKGSPVSAALSMDPMSEEDSYNDLPESENDPLPDYDKVLVYDRITGITKNIGLSSSGEEANGDCYEPSISADGRYVTFSSFADNLVSGDNNQMSDIFIRDRLLGTTNRISVSSNGSETDYDSYSSSISPDGTHVAFASWAANLVSGDTNNCADIFVRDLISGITKRISISYNGEESNGASYNYGDRFTNSAFKPSLNNDGSLVAFSSYATNLVPFDSNGYSDVFLYCPVTNFYTVYGEIIPNLLRSGNSTTIKAYADSNTESIIASILGNNYNLQFLSGAWILNYTIPPIPDGTYDVLLTAKNSRGIQANSTLHFTVDNTGPTITGSVNPDSLNMYTNAVTVTADSNNDTQSITATILGQTYNMYKADEHTWRLYYTVNNLSDGIYPIILTAKDILGNQGTATINFNIDNTPPTINAIINPTIAKVGELITITATSDADTKSIDAWIQNSGYSSFTKQADGSWITTFIPPQSYSGTFRVSLDAMDKAGNYGYFDLEYTIDAPPYIAISYPRLVKPNDSIIITVFSDLDAETAQCSIFGGTYNMIKQGENEIDSTWILNYTVPHIADGEYPIIFAVIDKGGNKATLDRKIWVDGTPPTIIGTLNPKLVKQGDLITIKASSDPDTQSMTATILGEKLPMIKQDDGTWKLTYTALNFTPGEIYYIELNALDFAGNRGNVSIMLEAFFPPVINPDVVKSGDNFTLTAHNFPDLENTKHMTARIFGETYNMTKQVDGTWKLTYTVPDTPNGQYSVALNANDSSGKEGNTLFVSFTVENSPRITANIAPNYVKSGDTFKITANSDQDTQSIIVRIFSDNITLYKNTEGTWSNNYTVPHVYDGNYFAIVTAISSSGRGTVYVNFTVDNTPPAISAEINPSEVNPGAKINIFASSSEDTENVSADFNNQTANLNNLFNLWTGDYNVPPNTALGPYSVALSASDQLGNTRSITVPYNVVESILPVINPDENQGGSIGGSQSGTIGSGTSTGPQTGSNNGGGSSTGGSGNSQGGISPGGNGPNGPSQTESPPGKDLQPPGPGDQQDPGPDGPPDPKDKDDEQDKFWDQIWDSLNQIFDFIMKILPFILLAIGILMVAGFFYPPLGIVLIAMMSVLLDILSIILTLLLRLLSLLIKVVPVLLRALGVEISAQGIFNFLNLLKFISNPSIIGTFFLIMGILGRFSYTAFRIVISPVYQFFSQTLGAHSWSQLLDSLRKK